MSVQELSVTVLDDSGDVRGSSFPVPGPWLEKIGQIKDIHASTLVPGAVRGNHFHVTRRELLLVLHAQPWSLHWDSGEGTDVTRRVFGGGGAVLVAVPPLSSHAIRNDGTTVLQIIGMTDGEYDPAAPDAYRRDVVG